jgi:hypothetical protein
VQDGRHCPECGKDVGIWAIKFAWFSNGRVRCRHCRRDLRYQIRTWESFIPLVLYLGCWVGADIAAPVLFRSRPVPTGMPTGLFLVGFLVVSFGAAAYLRARRSLQLSTAGR